jgi:ABC-type antimicrobial peptide transport system permease subunit
MRHEVSAAMPNLTVAGDLLLETQIDNILISERLLAWQAGFFSIVSLLLAGVGLYGVLTYVSVRRSHEIGIRIALGARPVAVVRLVARETTVPVIVGVVVGLGCGLGLARFLTSQLFRVEPTDFWSVVAPVACIVLTALTATIRPALRAVSMDPLVVLRSN